ncbi:Mu transposase C-terminal domain-containing protein [Gemmiger sp.]|uniref:Mu transposase C-terminal domain-containing protein n=1 Tax=Gemmiger sp. TaxID=2049027 RepID=UPI003AB303E9
MRVNDIFAAENGEHIRILLCSEEQCYAVSCQHFRMPFLLSAHELKGMNSISDEEYTIFTIDDDISAAQRCERDRRFALIKPLLDNACIYDKPHRNEIVKQIVGEHSVSRRTLLQYLWKYWVYQSKNILLPTGRTSAKAHELTADEKAIRWALNKYYYTPQKQSLQTAYKMMLQAKFCDAQGKLKPDYPTFWQFRYYFRQHRDPISETISRQGLKAYQRNHRPFTGSICDYAHTIGVYMTDATVADIYIVSRLSRKPIGRPVIYTMVDAYSRLITGVYVGLEGGQYALRLLLQNTFTDKVSFCHQHGIDIDPQDWPSHHLPTKIMTDRGSEFTSGPLENLCESYHIEIENLPAYRPDLKGVVEKLFDLIQSAYKPLLKGKGVIESDTQERGAPDYRRQGTLDLEQFTAVVLRCVLFYNAKSVQTGFTRAPAMIEANTPPLAASIWNFCTEQEDCPIREATDKRLLYTLLPRMEGRITQRGVEVFGLRYTNCNLKKRFVAAGLRGRESVQIAYMPECMDTIWLYENGTYTALALVQKTYLGKNLAEVADAQQREKVERTDWKKQELQAQLNLMDDIQSIANRSEHTMSDRGNISKQIQHNRCTARKQESVSLMDLLTEQQEDDFNDR